MSEQIWSPAQIYREGRDAAPPDLREVVRTAVRALAGDRDWVTEVSGGLDSALVAAALRPDQRDRVAAWVNHYVDQPEGDERAYARTVVDLFGGRLTEVRREGLRLDAERLSLSASGFRPAINDIDPDYNDDIAARIGIRRDYTYVTAHFRQRARRAYARKSRAQNNCLHVLPLRLFHL